MHGPLHMTGTLNIDRLTFATSVEPVHAVQYMLPCALPNTQVGALCASVCPPACIGRLTQQAAMTA